MTLMNDNFIQDPKELNAYRAFLLDKKITTYVELGVLQGQMLNYMKSNFNLTKCCGIDLIEPKLPLAAGIDFFKCNSHWWEYVELRQRIGKVDLVLIDAGHDAGDVFQDLLVEYSLGLTRFIAMHDVAPAHDGPNMAWRRIQDEMKLFYIDVGASMGMGVLKGPREGGKLLMKPITSPNW